MNNAACCLYTKIILFGLLSLLFAYSCAVQFNDATDGSKFAWITFYGLCCLVCAGVVVRMVVVQKKMASAALIQKAVLATAIATSVYGCTIIAMSAVELNDSYSSEKKEEVGYEMGGAVLGTVSSMGAVLALVVSCSESTDSRGEDDDDYERQ